METGDSRVPKRRAVVHQTSSGHEKLYGELLHHFDMWPDDGWDESQQPPAFVNVFRPFVIAFLQAPLRHGFEGRVTVPVSDALAEAGVFGYSDEQTCQLLVELIADSEGHSRHEGVYPVDVWQIPIVDRTAVLSVIDAFTHDPWDRDLFVEVLRLGGIWTSLSRSSLFLTCASDERQRLCSGWITTAAGACGVEIEWDQEST